MRWLAIFGLLYLCGLSGAQDGGHSQGGADSYSYCNDDNDCWSLLYPVCNANDYGDTYNAYSYGMCVPARCDNDADECKSSLLSCYQATGDCQPKWCSEDSQCSGSNVGCNPYQGYCDCIPGYSEYNGQCSPIFGRACIDRRECPGERFVCDSEAETCQCDRERWYQDDNSKECLSYLDKPCSDPDECGLHSNTTCKNDVCACKESFLQQDGKCVSVHNFPCEADSDCGGFPGMSCNKVYQGNGYYSDSHYYPSSTYHDSHSGYYSDHSYSGYSDSSYSGYSDSSYSGYDSSYSGYDGSYSGYDSSYSGYGSSYSGYDSSYSGYDNSYSGYDSSYPGYDSSFSGYDSSYSGYDGSYSGYDSSYSGYDSSYSGYSDSSYSGYDSSYSGYSDSSGYYDSSYSGYSDSSGYYGNSYSSGSYENGYSSSYYQGYGGTAYGQCKCGKGYAFVKNACRQVVGSSCDIVKCGDTDHWSYEDDYYYGYDSARDGYYCDVDNTCACRRGYKVDTEGKCQKIYGSYCTSDADCGTENGKHRCDVTTSKCTCGESYVVAYNVTGHNGYTNYNYSNYNYSNYNYSNYNYSDYYDSSYTSSSYYDNSNYDPYGMSNPQLCRPFFGLPCASYDCASVGGTCDVNGTCVCMQGDVQDGQCQQFLGHACEWDGPCRRVKHAVCGETGCECRHGYQENTDAMSCTEVEAPACSTDADCTTAGSACINDTCQDNAECANAKPMPDLYRRAPLYRVTMSEPMVRDNGLIEGWYNLGRYTLCDASAGLTEGYCGTKYPIYLTAALSGADVATLDGGNEVGKEATIGGLDTFGLSETLQVTFRKCGDDLIVKLPPSPIPFSAYCVDTGVGSNPARNSSNRWSQVGQDLSFYEDGVDENGATIYTPYVVFQCQAMDKRNNYYPTSYNTAGDTGGYTGPYFTDDGFYYTINWYINDQHYTSRGPVPRSKLKTTHLTELDIQHDYPTLGFRVRCSYTWSETLFGRLSAPTFSDDVYTGFRQTVLVAKADGAFHARMSDTPIGCRGPYTDEQTCSITWELADNADCSATLDPNPHPLCGVTLLGLTIAGIKYYGSYESAKYYLNTNSTHSYDEVDGTYQGYMEKTFGTNVMLDDSEPHDVTNTLKVRFAPASHPGHGFWNGYTMPDYKVVVPNKQNVGSYCVIGVAHVPMMVKTFIENGRQKMEYVTIDTPGEYVMLRSNDYPVEVQVKVEACDAASGGLCVCAVTYMNGDFIYTHDYCDGVYREGPLFGDGYVDMVTTGNLHVYEYMYKGRAINGVLGMVRYNQSLGSVLAVFEDQLSGESFSKMDGLCIMGLKTFTHSDGKRTVDQEGFVESWKLTPEESFLNPANYGRYKYEYSEDFYQCHCPLAHEPVPPSELTEESQGYERHNIHLGTFKCSMDTDCVTEHPGDFNWTGSVRPAYSLENVTLQTEQDSEGQLVIKCNFERDDQYTYRIKWFADKDEVHSTGTTTQVNIDALFQAFKAHGLGFAINKQWSCHITVLEGGIELLTTQSTPSVILEVPETRLQMSRVGETTLTLRLHVPVVCMDGDQDCSVEIMVYDEEDNYNCQDSTLAVKNMNTCGRRIYGVQKVQEAYPKDINIQLKTKNNNKYVLRDSFTATVEIITSGAVSGFWEGVYHQKITVLVRDDDVYWRNTYCAVTNDPRIITFDHLPYSIIDDTLTAEEFIMMKRTDKPVEVRMYTEACNGGLAACGCGVAVRDGRDVFMISHCNDVHITDYLQYDDQVLEAKRRSVNRYNIYLSYGAMVDVVYFRSTWFSVMNIVIYPSPDDMNKVVGLCGNFNGDRDDDLQDRDGVLTTIDDPYFWDIQPDDFSRSWGLHNSGRQSESFFLQDALESLTPWEKNDVQLCVCPLNDVNTREARCSVNEEQTCVGDGPERPGDDVEKRIRVERSADGWVDERKEDLWERLEEVRRRREDAFSATSEHRHRRGRRAAGDGTTIDKDEAERRCREALTSDCATANLNSSAPNGTDIETKINDCAKDLMLNDTLPWHESTCAVIQVAVENIVKQDVEFKTKNPEVVQTIKEQCVGNCGGHGTCIGENVCNCDPIYVGAECNLRKDRKPVNKGRQGNGKCSTGQHVCRSLRCATDGCVQNVQCKSDTVTYRKDADGSFVKDTPVTQIVPCSCDDGYNVHVDVENDDGKRRRRRREVDDTGDSDVIGKSYNIYISNDGTNYGDPNDFIVLDSTCLDFIAGEIYLQPGFCIVDGKCYHDGNSTEDGCKLCDVQHDPFNLRYTYSPGCEYEEEDKGKGKNKDGDGNGTPGYIIAIAVVIPVLLLGSAVAAVLYYLHHQKSKLKKARLDANLYDNSKNMHFRGRVTPTEQGTYIQPYVDTTGESIADPSTYSAPDNLYTEAGSSTGTVMPTAPPVVVSSPGPDIPTGVPGVTVSMETTSETHAE